MHTYTISITVQCPEKHSETLSDDMLATELALEDRVSQVLLELFGDPLLIDDVTVTPAAEDEDGWLRCA